LPFNLLSIALLELQEYSLEIVFVREIIFLVIKPFSCLNLSFFSLTSQDESTASQSSTDSLTHQQTYVFYVWFHPAHERVSIENSSSQSHSNLILLHHHHFKDSAASSSFACLKTRAVLCSFLLASMLWMLVCCTYSD
jgi:hypothetical protein